MFYLDKLNAIILRLVYTNVSLLRLDTVFEGMLECLEQGSRRGGGFGVFGGMCGLVVLFWFFGFFSPLHLPIFLDFLSS